MKMETFFEKFELLTDAPNALAKLREIILKLAVRGKLLPQDPNNEPASILLEKISKKKSLMTNQGRPLFQEFYTVHKQPYQLPRDWNWAYLDNICISIIGGGTPSKLRSELWDGDIPWASVKDLKGKYLEKTIDSITELGLKNSSTNLVKKGSIIICTRMGLGKIAINTIDVAINQDLKAIKLPEEIDKNYFYNFYITQNIVGTGVTVSGIRQKDLLRLAVPIPPLAEQKRIVEKCDRLLSLCNQIEVQQQKRQESIVRMNESAIAQLLSSQNTDEFSQHWQRICDNFDLLYSIPETIPKLRQVILQLAVQGKLVPQNINDESALSLLDRIRFEREELAREGKLAKLKNFSPVASDEIPYQLPKEWVWVSLGELLISSPRNGYSPKPVDYPTKVKSLTLSATTSGRFKNECFKYIDEEIEQDSHLWLEDGDILIQRANTIEYVGIAAIYKGYSHEYIYPDLMMKLRCSNFLEINYLHLAINNEISRNFLRARATGTSSNMPKINQLTVNSLPIPLPPLAEQKRIVAKCDRLISLCDTLEAKLKEARSHSEMLMEVAAKQVLVA
jgi:type I restriction enzyme S subunit